MTHDPSPSTEPVPPVGSTPAAAPAQAPPTPPTPPATSIPPTVGGPAPGNAPGVASGPAPEPTTSVGWVIAGVILFWPTAIPALFASQRAARALGMGDRATAAAEAARAKRWGIVSVCVAAGLFVLSAIVAFLWFLILAFAVHDDYRYDFHNDRYGMSYEYDSDLPFGIPDADDHWEFHGPSFGEPGVRSEDGQTWVVPGPDAGVREVPTPSEESTPSEAPTPSEESTRERPSPSPSAS